MSKFPKLYNYCEKLINGFAIEVKKEDVKEFLNLIKHYKRLILPEENTFSGETIQFKNEKYYFVLIGSKIYHTHSPKFGGQDFQIEVYEKN